MQFQPQVLYDFTNDTILKMFVIPVFGPIALYLVFAIFQNLPDNYNYRRKPSREFFAFWLAMAIFIGTAASGLVVYDYFNLRHIYKAKTYKVVEGSAKNLIQTKFYSFSVDSVSFSESNGVYGYKRRDEVKKGMPLRIFYDSITKSILHIEIVALPASADTAL